MGNAHQATFHHLPAVLVNGENPGYLEVGKCDTHLGSEGQFRELEACQPNLAAREGHGAGHSECHHMAWAGINQHKYGLLKGRSCLTNLISIYSKVTCLVDEEQTVDIVYLDFSKTFHTVSDSILLKKMAVQCVEECTLWWVKKTNKKTPNWQKTRQEAALCKEGTVSAMYLLDLDQKMEN